MHQVKKFKAYQYTNRYSLIINKIQQQFLNESQPLFTLQQTPIFLEPTKP